MRMSAVLLICVLPAWGATLTVTNLNDSGFGSLRASILTANAGDTIAFGVTGTITLLSELPMITQNLTIQGPGAGSVTVSGNGTITVIFHVGTPIATPTVTISGLIISNGNGVGGIANLGTLTVSNCVLSGNSSAGAGAGILNAGNLTVSNTTFMGNTANAGGGGIHNTTNGGPGNAVVVGSTFSGNSGGLVGGGGIFNFGGTISVVNSTFSGNAGAAGGGGGIFNSGGSASVANSTIANNTGGGVTNALGSVTLSATLLAASSGNCGGLITSLGYNLSDDNSCAGSFNQTGDRNNTPALLNGSLQNNGGPTQTIALQPSSPAVDAIPPGSCAVATDQRGISRPQGHGCDIGAFELVVNGNGGQPTAVPAMSSVALTGFALLLAMLGGLAARERMGA